MLTPEPTQVALKRFINDISVEVMEAQLVSKLSDILSALSICDMSDETVSRLAGESEESRAEREKLNRQVQVLQSGLETCNRFASVRMGGGMEPLTPATLVRRKCKTHFEHLLTGEGWCDIVEIFKAPIQQHPNCR